MARLSNQPDRATEAARRTSFIDAGVAEKDISRYLYKEKTYEEFEEEAKQNPSTVLPALWAYRNKWLQHPNELEARIAERDKAEAIIKVLNRKNDDLTKKTNVLNELLSLYRTT
jgi:hypothetical protein